MLHRVILGDNQFFGINHMSEDKEQALSQRFRDIGAITDVIELAYDCGIRGFMLNTHDRAKDICDYLRDNSSRFADICIYPSMPYAHKYANAVAEKGIFAALRDIVFSGTSAAKATGFLAKGGMTFFARDMIKLMEMLVDVEMRMFHGLNFRVIFLQNIITDLLLGFGARDVFLSFCEYIRGEYGVEPGFVTMNMPKLVDFLLDCGIENPVVCSSINKAGYLMNPSMEAYEETIRSRPFRPMAMSIFASGAISPAEAVDYVCGRLAVPSIVFGASSRRHIMETKEAIESYPGDSRRVFAQ